MHYTVVYMSWDSLCALTTRVVGKWLVGLLVAANTRGHINQSGVQVRSATRFSAVAASGDAE